MNFFKVFLLGLMLFTFTPGCVNEKWPGKAQRELKALNLEFNEENFSKSIQKGDPVAVRLFLEGGMDPDMTFKNCKEPYIREARPLFLVTSAEVAAILLSKGAQVNVKERGGWTPLMRVAYIDKKEIVDLFIAAGAEVNVQDSEGNTPLHYAAWHGSTEVVRSLTGKAQADKEIQNKRRITPLYLAITNRHNETVEHLVAMGAKVSGEDRDGFTPLHWAVSEGIAEISHYDKPPQKHCYHKFTIPAPFHDTKIVELLIAKGADINAQDRYGWTPLHWAVHEKNRDDVKVLLSRGADMDVKNAMGETPLEIAEILRDEKLVAMFKEELGARRKMHSAR
jgi:ankyrin repeat protein